MFIFIVIDSLSHLISWYYPAWYNIPGSELLNYFWASPLVYLPLDQITPGPSNVPHIMWLLVHQASDSPLDTLYFAMYPYLKGMSRMERSALGGMWQV